MKNGWNDGNRYLAWKILKLFSSIWKKYWALRITRFIFSFCILISSFISVTIQSQSSWVADEYLKTWIVGFGRCLFIQWCYFCNFAIWICDCARLIWFVSDSVATIYFYIFISLSAFFSLSLLLSNYLRLTFSLSLFARVYNCVVWKKKQISK